MDGMLEGTAKDESDGLVSLATLEETTTLLCSCRDGISFPPLFRRPAMVLRVAVVVEWALPRSRTTAGGSSGTEWESNRLASPSRVVVPTLPASPAAVEVVPLDVPPLARCDLLLAVPTPLAPPPPPRLPVIPLRSLSMAFGPPAFPTGNEVVGCGEASVGGEIPEAEADEEEAVVGIVVPAEPPPPSRPSFISRVGSPFLAFPLWLGWAEGGCEFASLTGSGLVLSFLWALFLVLPGGTAAPLLGFFWAMGVATIGGGEGTTGLLLAREGTIRGEVGSRVRLGRMCDEALLFCPRSFPTAAVVGREGAATTVKRDVFFKAEEDEG